MSFLNLFKKDKSSNEKNYQQTASVTNTVNNRILRLNNDDCALIFHPNGKLQVIFTKFYNNETQKITPEEQTLMAIAIFLKQPGFSQLLRNEFNNIAIKNLKVLTKTGDEQNE